MPQPPSSEPWSPDQIYAQVIEPGVCYYCAWQNMSLGVWVGQANQTAVQGMFHIGGQLSRRYPCGHSSVVFILDKVPAPTPELTDLMKRVLGLGSQLQCTAFVLEGSGFWASGLRSMLSNMHRAARGHVAIRIVTSIDEALQWLPNEHAQRTGIALERATLRNALTYVRVQGAALAMQGG